MNSAHHDVADYRETTESPAALVESADQALYAAKEAGRDRVVLAG